MSRVVLDPADEQELDRLLRIREGALNRQLGVTLLFTAVAFAMCLFCSLTGIFLTGRGLGVLAFLPGVILLSSGALVSRIFRDESNPRKWVKYYLLLMLYISVLFLALIQLVWAVPLVVGGAAFAYAYLNVRLTVIANTLIFLSLPIAAVVNAVWGMPNPDMLPYPETIAGIRDGYVTLWAMEHRTAWDTCEYFVRVLRYHTLPMLMLMMMITSCGFAMVRRGKDRHRLMLARARRLREIEACLLLMMDGNLSQDVIQAVLGDEGCSAAPRTLSPEFVQSIPPEEIPALMRSFRRRCEEDPTFADLAERNPEVALRTLR